MILRLDPRWTLVWRDPFTVQLGVDPPAVVLESVSSEEERLLAALAVGVTRAGLGVIASGRDDVVEHLLRRLAPALEAATEDAIARHPTAHPARDAPSVALTGEGRLLDLTTRVLGDSGLATTVARTPAALPDGDYALGVIVARGVVAPDANAFWLRRDVPHLAAVVGDATVRLGPLVEPGTGPCLVCVELHRRDADAAWPAIATQLLTRPPRDAPALLAAEAAATIARLVLARLGGTVGAPTMLRIHPDGTRTQRSVPRHPDCGCGGLRPVTSGTGWAGARVPRRTAPTTARDDGVPA